MPNDLLGSFESIGGTINVEFARPLAAGQSMELLFEFRGPVAAANLQLPFPAFIPLKAAERTGVIGLVSSAVWTPSVQPGVGMSRVGWLDLDSPLPPAGAWWSYRFRGSDPDGKVTLGTAHPVFTAERSAQVVPTQDGLEERTVLSLRVLRGGLSLVRIREYGSAIDRRAWRVLGGGNAVVSAVPLPLAILTGQFAFSPSADTRDCIWLVRLAQPASGALLLETTARITSPQRSQTLKPGDHTFPELDVLGSATAKNISAPGPQSARHLPTRQWQYQDLALVTTVFGREKVEVAFGGMIMAAGGGLIPFTLPPGAEVHEATVGERFIEPGILAAGGDVLRLPVTATPVRFEVRYRLPVESGRLIQAIRSPSPQLPGDKVEVRRWWRFGPDVLPEWPVKAWDRESAADLPERMGGIVRTGVSTVVWRSAMEEVRIASAAFAEVLGVALAAMIFALAWAAGRRRHWFFRFVTFGALLLLGSALFIGPPWWQRTAFLPTVVGLVAAGGMVIARGHRPRLPSTVAATIVACAVVHEPSTAQPALPATVIILPPDSMGRETVVAPKSLLDRLIDASNPSYPGVVVTGADYNATTNEAIARVSAKFTVHAFESNSVATLPLAEARLERVSVDGRPAFPAAPRLGIYSIQLSEKGRHEIEVDFAVPVTGTGTEREFRFGVPETPAAKVTANLPVSAKQTQITGRIGRQMAKM
ncbi:MAG TPA: hypothetical protein VLM40_06045, partial [Gemmata sp.]|nr:hypothetical protein [Gemmata sp.]